MHITQTHTVQIKVYQVCIYTCILYTFVYSVIKSISDKDTGKWRYKCLFTVCKMHSTYNHTGYGFIIKCNLCLFYISYISHQYTVFVYVKWFYSHLLTAIMIWGVSFSEVHHSYFSIVSVKIKVQLITDYTQTSLSRQEIYVYL